MKKSYNPRKGLPWRVQSFLITEEEISMNAIFSQKGYVLKQQGLAISGKYCLYDQNDNPLLYIEEKVKWIPPSTAIHVYADEKKTKEVLTLKDSSSEEVEMDVIDAESGQKIGGIVTSADDMSEIIKDAWAITDAEDKPIAKVAEISTGQSVLREVAGNELPQKLDIKVGETVVGELRQKVKMVGYALNIDFSMDILHALDRRLGIAAAIHVALHHGKEG
jgi:hypothetical protein